MCISIGNGSRELNLIIKCELYINQNQYNLIYFSFFIITMLTSLLLGDLLLVDSGEYVIVAYFDFT